MPKMIAKFQVQKVERVGVNCEQLHLMAVSSKPFDAEGASEDNSFARWTPSGELKMHISNPALIGQFKEGQKFYLEFTPADS
jgi:hypothetical protein